MECFMIPNIVDISLPKYTNEIYHNQYGNEYVFVKNENFDFT